MYDMGVSLSYNDAYQKDALANTITDHSLLSITPYFSKEYTFNKISFIPTIEVGYEHTLTNSLINQNIDYHKNALQNDFAAHTLSIYLIQRAEALLHK